MEFEVKTVTGTDDTQKGMMESPYVNIDFHVHTKFSSDGFNSFERIYRHARRNGLDAVAITDHDTIEGAIAFEKWLKDRHIEELRVIKGEERTCVDGTHIIGLFLEEEIRSVHPADVVSEIKAKGGLVYFPHPDRKDGILNSAYWNDVVALGDFYEAFNAKINHSFNQSAQDKIGELTGLKMLGGSDAHYNYDIGKCICTLEKRGDLLETLLFYKQSGSIRIHGVVKYGSNVYLPGYYRIRKYLYIPGFVKEFGKVLFPYYKNYKDSRKKILKEIIVDTIDKQ